MFSNDICVLGKTEPIRIIASFFRPVQTSCLRHKAKGMLFILSYTAMGGDKLFIVLGACLDF